MTSFTCQTCSTVSDDIGKHLSQTRHKKVTYDPSGEAVGCSGCGDSNIHVLRVLRYNLTALSLLCNLCYLQSDSTATAEYTLSNGTLLTRLPQYYTFRDLSCEKCGNNETLFFRKLNGKHHVVCEDCKGDSKGPTYKPVGEESEKILSSLLGIEESSSKPHSKTKGPNKKVDKKGGKKSGPKILDPEAEKRKAHYENTKATKNALKSGKTIKAVSSGTQSPSFSRSATPVPQDKTKNNNSSKSATNIIKAKPSKETKPKKSPPSQKAGEPTRPKSGHKNPSPVKSEVSKPEKPKSASENKASEPKSAGKGGQNGTKVPAISPKGDKTPKSQTKKGSSEAKPPQIKAAEKSKKPGKIEKNANGSGETKETQKAPVKVPQIRYPPGISKYEPSPTPKLSYDSMNEYFNEMCYNLFLEEKISLNTSSKSLLTAQDFDLEWYAEQDRKHKQFKLSILLSPEFLDRFQQKKMQTLKRKPFNEGQSVILILGDDIPWYGNIVYAETEGTGKKSGKKGNFKGRKGPRKDGSPQLLELIVELYPWNNMPLPTTCDVNMLRILPVSVPVSRVFTAMSRISNPRFIDMILGKKPIRQIFFKNYLKFTRDTFNDSQKVAIQSVLNNSITVLQGPPGTGKTSTIYEIILQLLDNLNTYPILVVAASNIAIDNIAEKLLPKHSNSILRIVSAEKESEYNREHPLASICLHHKVFDGLPAQLQELFREMRRPNSSISANQFKKLMTTQISYSDKIIASSRVIFTTTVSAGGNQLKSIQKMPVVIMDEATQSSEPTTLIPLSMNGVEKFVFVGDQRQLSSFSQVPNLSLSLFERILSNGTYNTPHMLDTQYRMHPAISKFSRMKFYDGLLKDGITAADRVKEGIPSNPLLFWDTKGNAPEGTVFSRFREDSGLTYFNKGEVDYVQKVLTYLIYEKNIPRSTIGVITPYRGQRDTLSSTLVKDELVNPEKDEVHIEVDREDFFNDSKPVTIHSVADIMIASVDAFQGREKDFLIMSCVRSNKQNKIGFLSDARRMNVALTRARYGMILIGDVDCLKSADSLWKEYITSLEESNSIFSGTDFSYS